MKTTEKTICKQVSRWEFFDFLSEITFNALDALKKCEEMKMLFLESKLSCDKYRVWCNPSNDKYSLYQIV